MKRLSMRRRCRGILHQFLWLSVCFMAEFVSAQATKQSDPSNPAAEEAGAATDSVVTSSLASRRWAIIVGISKYADQGIGDLNFADRDAEALYELIQKPTTGGFPKSNILKLVNEQATTAAITQGLRTFLKKPEADDVVLLFFSCHGVPDPDRPEQVYFATHDTKVADVSGTALPMREVELCLGDTLHAKRVVVLADTCHSGAINNNGRKNLKSITGKFVANFETLIERSKPGTAMLASAEADESSVEDAKWGGGHGVFTHFVLEALRGKADVGMQDGIVSIGELFDYVRENVKQATNDRQHPALGPQGFDRNFPMAITAEISARLHLDIGKRLYEIGRRQEDPRLLQSAAEHLRRAADWLAESDSVEAIRLCGMAQLAANDPVAASRSFQDALQLDRKERFVDLFYYLGTARLIQQPASDEEDERYSADALAAFEAFVAKSPDDERAPWAKQTIQWLKSKQVAKRQRSYALLFGTNEIKGLPPLFGVERDVLRVKEALSAWAGFSPENIATLVGKDATSDNFLRELDRLKKTAKVEDRVIVYFSGRTSKFGEGYLVGADFVLGDATTPDNRKTVGVKQLHQALAAIPAATCLIVDASQNEGFANLSKTAEYSTVFGCSLGQNTMDDRTGGFFTSAFIQALKELEGPATLSDLFRGINRHSRDLDRSRPTMLEHSKKFIVSPAPHPGVWSALSERRLFPELEISEIVSKLSQISQGDHVALPNLQVALMDALLDRGEWSNVERSLETLRMKPGDSLWGEARLTQARSHLHGGRFAEAVTALEQWLPTVDLADEDRKAFGDATAEAKALQPDRKPMFSLLVGIDDYLDTSVAHFKGAVNDVRAVKWLLENRLGVPSQNIVVLENKAATAAALLEEFRKLADRSKTSPALFYFSGLATTLGDPFSIVSVDGGTAAHPNIELKDLAGIVDTPQNNLTTIIDAAWPAKERLFVKPLSKSLGVGPPPPLVRIGRHTLYSNFFNFFPSAKIRAEMELESFPYDNDKPPRRMHGILTHALIKSLDEQRSIRTYDDWRQESTTRLSLPVYGRTKENTEQGLTPPQFVSINSREKLFINSTIGDKVEDALREMERRRIRGCVEQLSRLVDENTDLVADAQLDLGILAGMLGDYDRSIVALKSALSRPSAADRTAELHYRLGRVLYESGRSEEAESAVAELRSAVQLNKKNDRARYYFAGAIRRLVERNLLEEAREQTQAYLDAGAPLGHREEAENFLRPVPPPSLDR